MTDRSRVACLATLFAFAFAFSATPSTAQCVDPTPPAGGFGVTIVANQIVAYGDGAQTMVDVRHPSAAPGPCGWPVVLLVHGLTGNRGSMSGFATYFAQRGYLTAAYDVRGQGYAATANPHSLGATFVGEVERLDMAELVAWIDSTFGSSGSGVADTSRLGITGISQGAAHSWAAAAMSGRTVPANGRGITTFPTFAAAYPMILSPLEGRFSVPQGMALSQPTAAAVLLNIPQLEWTPSYQNTLTNLMSVGDFPGVVAFYDGDPWRQDVPKLATSTVPVMVHAQWNDVFLPVENVIAALDVLPATTPTRAVLSPFFAHSEPRNDRQVDLTTWSAQRWFDRFLKNIPNQVELEPRFVSGVVAETRAEHASSSSLLWHRYSDTWPPAGTSTRTFYLRWARILDPNPPTAPENTRRISHVVNAAASLPAFIAGGATPNLITNWFNFSQHRYDTAIQTSAMEIAGSPRAELEVTPTGPDFQLHCALYQVHANQVERYLQSGVALVRGNASPQRVVVDFHDIHALILPGERLRLRIQNLTRRFPAGLPVGQFDYYTVPYFQSVDVRIEHSPRLSKLEIPVADVVRPALSSRTQFFDTLRPSDVTLELESTPTFAGRQYFVLFGASGITPGFPVPGGGRALLNVDALTTDLLPLINTAFLPACAGVLNAAGSASPSPQVRLSAVPGLTALIGLRMVALGAVPITGGFLVTNPVDWVFQ